MAFLITGIKLLHTGSNLARGLVMHVALNLYGLRRSSGM